MKPSKIKIVTIQKIRLRSWDMQDDCYISNLAKIYVCVVIHSRIIVSPNFRNLCVTLEKRHIEVNNSSTGIIVQLAKS